jgi:hypothetical protein
MRLLTVSTILAYSAATVLAAEPPSGLLMVLSKPNHPELTEKVYNDWYSHEHIQDMVKSGLTDLVLRYKNVNSTAQYPYLAIYRLPDVRLLQDKKVMGAITPTSQKLPGKTKGSKGGAYADVLSMETRAYARIQTFEGQIEKKGRGKGLIISTQQPGNEADYDDWYRRQHLDMLRYLTAHTLT